MAELGLKVSFLEESKSKCGFFFYPDKEDISYPVLPDECVVLKAPSYEEYNRKFGFKHNVGLIKLQNIFQCHLAIGSSN